MFCPNCGTQNVENALFCASCGAKLQETAAQPTFGSAFDMSQQAPTPETPVAPTENAQQAQTPETPAAPTENTQAAPAQQTAPVNNAQPIFGSDFSATQPVSNQGAPVPPVYGQAAPGMQGTPGTPGMQMAPGMQAAPVAPKPPKAPFKISKLLIAVIAEAVVLVAMIVVFFLVGKSTYSYEKVAEKYFESVMEADWRGAYSQLDISESDFVNEDLFAAANEGTEAVEINQYKVISSFDRGLTATVNIQYSEKGSSSVSTMSITLNKQAKKNFLFFDGWKVSGEDYVATDFEIDVPAGVTVYLDGVELPATLKDPNSEYSDYYIVPRVVKGTHEVYMTLGDFSSKPETVSVNYDDGYYSISRFEITQEQQTELFEKAYGDFQTIVSNAVNGGDFSAIQNLYAADTTEDAKYEYENYFTYKFAAFNEGTSGITDVALTDVTADFWDMYTSGGNIYVEVDLNYYYTVQYIYPGGFFTAPYMGEYDNSNSMYMYYVYEDGEWKLSNSSMPSLYY